MKSVIHQRKGRVPCKLSTYYAIFSFVFIGYFTVSRIVSFKLKLLQYFYKIMRFMPLCQRRIRRKSENISSLKKELGESR